MVPLVAMDADVLFGALAKRLRFGSRSPVSLRLGPSFGSFFRARYQWIDTIEDEAFPQLLGLPTRCRQADVVQASQTHVMPGAITLVSEYPTSIDEIGRASCR